MNKAFRHIFTGLFLLLLCSCGIKSYRTFESGSAKIQVFNDSEIKCEFSQVIYDNSSTANIYLDFQTTSTTATQIENVSGQFKWEQNGQIVSSPFHLTSIYIGVFKDGHSISDSTFQLTSFIPDNFKNVSGTNHSLLYNLEFGDTTFKFIPSDVSKIFIKLDIEIKSGEKVKQYKKTIEVSEDKHHYFWFLRDC